MCERECEIIAGTVVGQTLRVVTRFVIGADGQTAFKRQRGRYYAGGAA